jgi:hypothetical protein
MWPGLDGLIPLLGSTFKVCPHDNGWELAQAIVSLKPGFDGSSTNPLPKHDTPEAEGQEAVAAVMGTSTAKKFMTGTLPGAIGGWVLLDPRVTSAKSTSSETGLGLATA